MKWSHPEFERIFDTTSGLVSTLVVENRPLFVRILEDIHHQLDGFNGNSILSENDVPVTFSKCADIIDTFVPFEINKKQILSKIINALEKTATSSENTVKTANILNELQDYLGEISFEYPSDIVFPKLCINGILRSAGVELRNEYQTISEAVIDYMEVVRTFDRDKVFFTVNMRCFVTDEEISSFMSTAISHGYHIIMIESFAYSLLKIEKRTVIDDDLCEI